MARTHRPMVDPTPAHILRVSARAHCLYTEAEVEAALDRLAQEITAKLAESNPLLLCVMTGAVVVTGKLATRLAFPLQIDYLHATRYRAATSGGELVWERHPAASLAGRTVLIIDDILDEGITLARIVEYCREQGCKRVLVAVLVNKIHDRKAPIEADFVGLDTEDYYLYGYGMDYKGYLRNAPGIYAVAPKDI